MAIRYCWLDLEMTGLDPEQDVILELAFMLTDVDLVPVTQSYVFVMHHEKLPKMDDFVTKLHTSSGLLESVKTSKLSVAAVEAEVTKILKEQEKDTVFYLAGNTIYKDRSFLRAYMPKLEKIFHYRMIDVSTFKILLKSWYPKSPEVDFIKAKKHRADIDILESIAELKHYKKYFFIASE